MRGGMARVKGHVPGLTERSRRVAVRLAGVAVATGGLALMGFGTIGSPLASGGTAAAAPAAGGNNNKGDVFVDNVGNPCCPGHEQDPHLTCTNINLWGDGMADPTGNYVIDGWPPSGSMEQDYPTTGQGTWTYNQTQGGTQVIDVINVTTLINNAIANGDTPQANQGYHFKLQLVQAPQKHKTFWVDCAATTTTSSTTSSTGSSTSSTSSSTSTQSTTVRTSTTSKTTKTKTTTKTTTKTKTKTTSTTAASSTSSTPASSSSTTAVPPVSTATSSSVGTGTLGTGTTTPSTGADAEFGLGLGLVIAGGGLVAAAARMGRKPRG